MTKLLVVITKYSKINQQIRKELCLCTCSKADTYIYGIRDAQKAIPILKKILQLYPNSIELFIICAEKFAVCGEYDQAIKINEKVISKDPNNIEARFAKLNLA